MSPVISRDRPAFFPTTRPSVLRGGRLPIPGSMKRQTGLHPLSSVCGLTPGDHVALCAGNCLEWTIAYFGILKAGTVAVTLSNSLPFEELSLLVNHAKPRAVLTDRVSDFERLSAAAPWLEHVIALHGEPGLAGLTHGVTEHVRAVDRLRTDVAAILYTGGTTGIPKG